MNRQKLIELRCKAWGITEDEYYCNQCSDFSLEDMARAYRRGKNKGRADLEAQIEKMKCCENCAWWYKLPNGQRDCAETCENLDNWSLRR